MRYDAAVRSYRFPALALAVALGLNLVLAPWTRRHHPVLLMTVAVASLVVAALMLWLRAGRDPARMAARKAARRESDARAAVERQPRSLDAIRDDAIANAPRAGEAKFRGVVDAAPDGIVMARADGRITLVNAQAAAMLGYSPEELVGAPVERLLPDVLRSR